MWFDISIALTRYPTRRQTSHFGTMSRMNLTGPSTLAAILGLLTAGAQAQVSTDGAQSLSFFAAPAQEERAAAEAY